MNATQRIKAILSPETPLEPNTRLTDDEKQRWAEDSRAILENPVLNEALTAIEDEATAAWKDGKNTEERENSWVAYQSVALLKYKIRSYIETGDVTRAMSRRRSL